MDRVVLLKWLRDFHKTEYYREIRAFAKTIADAHRDNLCVFEESQTLTSLTHEQGVIEGLDLDIVGEMISHLQEREREDQEKERS